MSKKSPVTKTSVALTRRIEEAIYLIRGERVMLDADLAELYGVTTGNFNKAVKRDLDRFPEDFMFQLTKEEADELLRFQTGISKRGRGGRRFRPYAFTEQGAAMLASILRSKRAVQVNIEIVRTFVRLRRFLAAHEEIAKKVAALEKKSKQHDIYLQAFFKAIQKLMPQAPSLAAGSASFRRTKASKPHLTLTQHSSPRWPLPSRAVPMV
jgi:hypothetical protein